jgi:AcrR family transcriptional regulator
MPAARNAPDETRRSERARLAILTASAELIRTVGYDTMTIEAIAATAGVGKQTIYRWWPSKAAIVLDMLTPEVHPRIEFPDTGDLAADLKSQLRTAIDLNRDPVIGASYRALIAESQHDEELAKQLVDYYRPRIAACKDRLRAGQAAGQLRPDIDLDVAVDLIYGGFYHRNLLHIFPLTDKYADAIVDAALNGIGSQSPMDPTTRSSPRSRATRKPTGETRSPPR